MVTTTACIQSFLHKYSYMISLLALAAITVASLSPRGSSGDPGAVGVPDSMAHVVAYATVLFFRAVTPSAPLFWPVLMVFTWSSVVEALQPLVGRSLSLHDIAANATGIILGTLVGYALRRLLFQVSAA